MGDAGSAQRCVSCVGLSLLTRVSRVLLGINDISKRSDLPKVLMKVEEKFRLDLSGTYRHF
jgi:hypothetical protein